MLIPELAPQKKIIVGKGIFFHTFIKDNNQCKSHGKDMYIQMMEYIAYDGAYDKDTNTFTYNPDAAEHTDSGEMEWHCGHCDRLIEWVGHEPKVDVE